MVDVKNDMEQLVRSEVSRRKKSGADKKRACWCQLCEADVVALALNKLPPRYCRSVNFGYAAAQGLGGQVAEAVSEAFDKVSHRPKHPPGAPDRSRSEAWPEDFGLKIGSSVIGFSFVVVGACSCDTCRYDALALALNHCPPKYGVSSPGRESYQANYEDFTRHEIGLALTKAFRVVGANPHH